MSHGTIQQYALSAYSLVESYEAAAALKYTHVYFYMGGRS